MLGGLNTTKFIWPGIYTVGVLCAPLTSLSNTYLNNYMVKSQIKDRMKNALESQWYFKPTFFTDKTLMNIKVSKRRQYHFTPRTFVRVLWYLNQLKSHVKLNDPGKKWQPHNLWHKKSHLRKCAKSTRN